MNPTLGAILLGFLSLPIIFQLYFGYAISYMVAYLMPCPVEDNAEFDFIVVGAGSAGSVVAGRLAEAGHQVLLVEAGGPSNWIQSIPGLVLASQQTPYDWAYKTEPQEHSMGAMNNRQSAWPRGKVLGGSSMLNYMLYVRGNPKDYDEWESFGNPGWGYKDVLPFFKKSENFHRSEADPKYHGTGGPLGVLEGRDYPEISKIFLEAGKEMGYTVGDYNGDAADKETLYIGQMSVKDGKRTGTYQAFAEPFVGRGLTVLTFAHVTKVLINGGNNANGIELMRFGQKITLKAKNEIILSAGGIGSPQILLLSGIGPKQHLQSLNIDVMHDLQGVGENLQDHVLTSMWIKSANEEQIGVHPFSIVNPLHYFNYLIWGKGTLASNGIEAGAFFYSGVSNDTWKRPDIQLHTTSLTFFVDYGLMYKTALNLADNFFYGTYGDFENSDGGLICPSLLRPKSRGHIKLRSSDPMDPPVIQPNYYSQPEDVETMKAGLKWSFKMTKTKTFKKNNVHVYLDKYGCGKFEPFSDDYFECSLKHWSHTIYHPVGTCKMGPNSDSLAVVDSKLQVFGIRNLRVIDASIMPTIVGANTNAATIMIGEKGAAMIIEKWGQKEVHNSENVSKVDL